MGKNVSLPKTKMSFIIFIRYLPQNPADLKETCRSSQKITLIYLIIISENQFLSTVKAHKFLLEMKKSSKCNCLPDCELFDIQHSVSTTNFM